MPKFKFLSWTETLDMMYELAFMIASSRIEYQAVIAIGHGGVIPGRVVFDVVNAEKMIYVRISKYDIKGNAKRRVEFEGLRSRLNDMNLKSAIIVDDVAETGETLSLVKSAVLSSKIERVNTAVLVLKPWSTIIPDYYVKTMESWVIFPWEYMSFKKCLPCNTGT